MRTREFVRLVIQKIERGCGPLSDEERQRVIESARERVKHHPELLRLLEPCPRAVVDPSAEEPR